MTLSFKLLAVNIEAGAEAEKFASLRGCALSGITVRRFTDFESYFNGAGRNRSANEESFFLKHLFCGKIWRKIEDDAI